MIRMSDNEFEMFCKLMQEDYGIDLRKKRILIEYRMLEELKKRKMKQFKDYLVMMKQECDGKLHQVMIDQLTTNYTYFCREMSHYQFIEQMILPQLIDMREDFRILVAGCSSGQECYTLMMLLENYRFHQHDLPIVKIHGCDINHKVLKTASKACYPLHTLNELPDTWQRYVRVDQQQKCFIISSDLCRHVNFMFHNLMKPFSSGKYHMIMCRNVMIYFNEEARQIALQNLNMALMPGGYLILGHAEVLTKLPKGFIYCGDSIYQKCTSHEQMGDVAIKGRVMNCEK